MRYIWLLLIFCTSAQQCCAQRKTAAPKLAFNDIRGAWIAETVTVDGASIPKEIATQFQWTFKDEQTLIIQQQKNGPTDKCVLRFNPDSKPVSFQFDAPIDKVKKPPTNSDVANVNPIVIGILKLESNQLIVNLCRRSRTPARPKSFKSTSDSDTILIKFSRPSKKLKRPPETGQITK